VDGEKGTDMTNRGDDFSVPAPEDAIPPAAPAAQIVRVFVERDGRRVLLAAGPLDRIDRVISSSRRGDSAPRAGDVLDTLRRFPIHAALLDGPLGREAGLSTWVRTSVLYRLCYGLDEEQPSLDLLVNRYGVELRGLVARVVTAALRSHAEGRTAPITAAHQRTLRRAADALAVRRDMLAAAWNDRVRRDVARGWTATHAVEMLDVDALHDAIGLAFDHGVVAPVTDRVQQAALVLRRAALTAGGPPGRTPAADEVRVLFNRAASILDDSRPVLAGGRATTAGFRRQIEATERLLRGVRRQSRKAGRPVLVVERAVATDLVTFLDRETGQKLLGHAAVLLAVACPRLAGWRKWALDKVCRDLDLGPCRPNVLPRPARTLYVDLLGRRLHTLLYAPA
jgi:hypothetical protein